MKTKRKKQAKRDDFYFDDCTVCRAMKYAEENGGKFPSPRELREAFLDAKKKGAVVGGPFLDEKVEKIHKC